MKAQQIIDAVESGELSWDEVIIFLEWVFGNVKQFIRLVKWE